MCCSPALESSSSPPGAQAWHAPARAPARPRSQPKLGPAPPRPHPPSPLAAHTRTRTPARPSMANSQRNQSTPRILRARLDPLQPPRSLPIQLPPEGISTPRTARTLTGAPPQAPRSSSYRQPHVAPPARARARQIRLASRATARPSRINRTRRKIADNKHALNDQLEQGTYKAATGSLDGLEVASQAWRHNGGARAGARGETRLIFGCAAGGRAGAAGVG